MPETFAALPSGYYRFLFLHLEPISTFFPLILVLFQDKAAWFRHVQIPSDTPVPTSIDDRTKMVVLQLVNCFFLFGVLSSVVLRAIRSALPSDPVAQERIIAAFLFALGSADLGHILFTLIGLPEEFRFHPLKWNFMTHGNITFTTMLFISRVSWFFGIGRTRFYYGQNLAVTEKAKSKSH